MKRIYLAVPYSHINEEIREQRFIQVTAKTLDLMNQGHLVFSPISYGHLLSIMGNLPVEFEYHEESCMSYIENWATHLYVLCLEGWEQSVGVQAEIARAKKLNIPITYIKDSYGKHKNAKWNV